MKNLKSVMSVFAVSAVISLSLGGAAHAGDAQVKNVNDFTCKDVMRTSAADRDIAVAFMHGYLLAKSGKDTFNKATLGAATDNFVEACLDNPKDVAIATMKKQLK